MMTSIFLDINGVCQPYITAASLLKEQPFNPDLPALLAEKLGDERILLLSTADANRIWNEFDHDAMKRLKKLADENDLFFIITSSWTMHYSFREIQAIFAMFGLGDAIEDCIVSSSPRSEYIKEYIEDTGLENYMVFDDLDMRDLFGPRQVLCPGSFDETSFKSAQAFLERSRP